LIGVRTPTIFHADLDRGLLVLEYLETASTCRDFLRQLWPNRDCPDESKILRQLAADIGQTVAQLHKNNIIHGDLTTSNILVESQ
jgi:TP53 regulating kinase-like protein